MDQEIRELHGAVSRGETVYCKRYNEPEGTEHEWIDRCGVDLGHPNYKWWVKPKTTTLAGKEFPDPLRVAPESDAKVFLVYPFADKGFMPFNWTNIPTAMRHLKRGLIQATEEGAKAQAEATVLAYGGSSK